MTEKEKLVSACEYGGCREVLPAMCKRCGFNKDEIERRNRLELVMGRDGLMRKFVGMKEAAG